MRALPASGRLAGAVLACLLVASACTNSDDTPPTPAAGEQPSTQPPATPPTTTTGAASPSATATASPSPETLTDRLLPTSAVPGLNAAWRWQDGETGPASTEPFGFCAKVDLASIGATEVVERSYFPPDDSDDNAAEQVAEFADATSAAQAWSVLGAWRRKCGQSISADLGLKVRPMTAVPVAAGTARWYLLSWNPVGEETGRFEAIGMVRNGTRIAVLRMTNSGQDYNYPAGQEPMVAMVQAAAKTLG
jgi:hypothetical protein